jgi:hypothetical protein
VATSCLQLRVLDGIAHSSEVPGAAGEGREIQIRGLAAATRQTGCLLCQ